MGRSGPSAAVRHALHGWRRVGLCALLAVCSPGAPSQAGDEEQLMAAVLSRVLLFTRWPDASAPASQALVVCAPADHPLAQALARLPAASARARTLVVRASPDTADQGCQVRLLGDHPLPPPPPSGELRVGLGLGALERGAMLGLQVQRGRVSFDIDQQASRRAGIEFDSQLLRLARYVRKAD